MSSTDTTRSGPTALASRVACELPRWRSVLAVVAHPDDESFGLGAVLAAFVDAGASVAVLCFTRGEASTLHGTPGDLQLIRAGELMAAGRAIGVMETTLLGYADGRLAAADPAALAAEVGHAAARIGADGLVAFDPGGVSGHPDHVAATAAALAGADRTGLPVLGWTLPAGVADTLNAERGTGFRGHPAGEIDCVVAVDRRRQQAAIGAHASQALPTSVLWRRLELLGDAEHLRRLRPAPLGMLPDPIR